MACHVPIFRKIEEVELLVSVNTNGHMFPEYAFDAILTETMSTPIISGKLNWVIHVV